ncbi:MAG: ABC transporter ATP-binding protein [Candidatus Thermoplasmatota archaeon]|nr:ABC transporter ATP-binding protein [Candidatus Thermoplasmatota archaeon]
MPGASSGQHPLLVATGLERAYGKGEDATHALQGASLTLQAGELVVVKGRSGSGKTTFLNLVSGLDHADAGSVRLFGQDLDTLEVDDRLALRAEAIGFVFQDPALVPELKLWENVAMAARIAGLSGSDARKRARRVLLEVGLGGLEDRFPGEISGGEAQRASVARALVKRPRLLLADEPTANLDHATAEQVADLLLAYVQDQAAGALVVTHDDIMARRAHRAYHLVDGRFQAPEPAP